MDRTQEIIINSLWDDNTQINKAILNIKPEFFIDPVLRDIYKKTIQTYTKNNSVDPVSISGLYPDLFDEVHKITQITSTFDLSPFYKKIKDIYKKDQLFKLSNKIKARLENDADSFKIINDITDTLVAMSDHGVAKPKNMEECANDHMEIFKEGKDVVFRTGIDSLDNGFNLKNGQVCVVGGGTGWGKSVFLNTIATNMCLNGSSKGLIFNYEMLNTENTSRLYAATGGISLNYFSGDRLLKSKKHMALYGATADYFIKNKNSLHLEDNPRLNITDVYALCKMYKDSYDIDVVGVDYLQLMPKLDFRMDDRRSIEHNSRELKRIANELNIKMFILSQLSNDILKRTGDQRRPKLSDIRESGAITHDADKVIFPFPTCRIDKMPFAIDGNMPGTNEGEIFVAKNRQGVAKVVKVYNNFDKARFEDFEEDEEEKVKF